MNFYAGANENAIVGDGSAITPSSPYAPGLNSVVVQGSDETAPGVADRIAASSGRDVIAMWMLKAGSWLYYLPGYPWLDGGLHSFATEPAGLLVILS